MSKNTIIEEFETGKRDFSHRNLRGFDLGLAHLVGVDLSHSDLTFAHLADADLRGADLRGADLRWANLKGADLEGANLNDANLEFANLEKTNLEWVKRRNLEFIRGKILDAPIIAYKCVNKDVIVNIYLDSLRISLANVSIPMIIKLQVPTDSVVFCINGSKCRTNKARVLEFVKPDPYMIKIIYPYIVRLWTNVYKNAEIREGDLKFEIVDYLEDKPAYSLNMSHYFAYGLEEIVKVEDFDLQYNVECSTGIHFFISKEEAMEYAEKYVASFCIRRI